MHADHHSGSALRRRPGDVLIRAVRMPQRRHCTRRCAYTTVTGCDAHGRSSHVRSRMERTRPVRPPQPLHRYRRMPRRSIRIVRRLSGAAPSLSAVTTRNAANPKIHVQWRRDPTGPPLLVAHQERTPSNSGWPPGIARATSRPPSRPPTPTAVRAGGQY